jgi:hypothetical protein
VYKTEGRNFKEISRQTREKLKHEQKKETEADNIKGMEKRGINMRQIKENIMEDV